MTAYAAIISANRIASWQISKGIKSLPEDALQPSLSKR